MITVTVSRGNGRWEVRFPYDAALKDAIKSMQGFRWDPNARCWYTLTHGVVQPLLDDPEHLHKLAQALRDAEEMSRATGEALTPEQVADIPAPSGLSYRPYQVAGIRYATGRRATLIADEMGLGKTVQAIGVANADPNICNVLIICPASVKVMWFRMWQKWCVRKGLIPQIANNGLLPVTPVVITNFERVAKQRKDIDSRQWDLLIIDECHKLKSPDAQRTVAIYGKRGRRNEPPKPGIKAKKVLLLSGTPSPNRPVELLPMLEYADPDGLGKNSWMFLQRYCGPTHNGWGWDFTGASNTAELQARLRQNLMIRRLKVDVEKELPEKVRQVIELPPTPAIAEIVQREIATEARWAEVIEEAKRTIASAKNGAIAEGDEYLAAVSRLRETNLVAFDEMSRMAHELAVAKVPLVVEFVEDILDDQQKVVIMAHHQDVIEELTQALAGYGAVKLVGGMTQDARQRSVDRFQDDPTCRVFVGSIQAAGVGITLTASSTVVFAELDWVPGNMTQAEDRCHRIGQTNTVVVYHCVVDGSLDVRRAHAIMDKQEVLYRVLDQTPIAPLANIAPAAQPATPKSEKRDRIARIAEKVQPGDAEIMLAGLRILDILNPDRAGLLNNVGYNSADTDIGHDLAMRTTLSAKQTALAATILHKYHRQLPKEVNDTIEKLVS